MRYIRPLKAGIAVGVALGLYHLVWASLVALGWAKPLMDFILRLHFIHLDYAIEPFAPGAAAALIGVTAAIGFLFGLVFAIVWNRLAVASGAV